MLSSSHGSGVGHLCTCARAPPSPYLRIRVANCAKIWCVARDPIVTRFTRVGGGVTTFARACPVSLSRKPLSPGIKATPKTDLSPSRSLVHRQTWRLTGFTIRLSIFLTLARACDKRFSADHDTMLSLLIKAFGPWTFTFYQTVFFLSYFQKGSGQNIKSLFFFRLLTLRISEYV